MWCVVSSLEQGASYLHEIIYGPADATATHHRLLHLNPELLNLSGAGLDLPKFS